MSRGERLERQVADWLKELGYGHVELRKLARGKDTIRPWEVDVYAKHTGLRGAWNTDDVWVECKAIKIKRAHVAKLVQAVEDVRNAHSKGISDWEPKRITMVSSVGFDVDATTLAKKHRIECWLKKDDGFEHLNKKEGFFPLGS